MSNKRFSWGVLHNLVASFHFNFSLTTLLPVNDWLAKAKYYTLPARFPISPPLISVPFLLTLLGKSFKPICIWKSNLSFGKFILCHLYLLWWLPSPWHVFSGSFGAYSYARVYISCHQVLRLLQGRLRVSFFLMDRPQAWSGGFMCDRSSVYVC